MAQMTRVGRLMLACSALLLIAGLGIVATGTTSADRAVGPSGTAMAQWTGDPSAADQSGVRGSLSSVDVARRSVSAAMAGMTMPASSSGQGSISVASLRGPTKAARIDTFTLTARPARITLAPGKTVDAWTYDGVVPGPMLRVRQGDLVVVHVVNRLPVPTTIHWHGVLVPAGEDGVAGVTQDAILPGHTNTYRFIATLPGTYWYHAHQDGSVQVARGLFGPLVVEPRQRMPLDDVDHTVVLHTWEIGGNDVLAFGSSSTVTHVAAAPGATVRLRFVNTDNYPIVLALSGTPFTVVALDGHDLNGPTPIGNVALPIGAGQRYDVRFRMPAGRAVGVRAFNGVTTEQDPLVDSQLGIVVGTGSLPDEPPPPAWFDFATYGKPLAAVTRAFDHPDATYNLVIGEYKGLTLAHYNINDRIAPDIPPIVVTRGQVVQLHIVNKSSDVHPMHLHGHVFLVLRLNGRHLTGSPIQLDTIDVFPGESADVAFVADNPGIWMLHCHNLLHAASGLMMMVIYRGVTTPFSESGPAGNIAD